MSSRVLPNFLVFGAGKAGTSALYNWLASHPQIFVPGIKETNYFAYAAVASSSGIELRRNTKDRFPVRDLSEYMGLFNGSESFRARGEVSPTYLAVAGVPEKIFEHLPDVRLIAVLRNPVDRAYSSYLMHRRDGREHRTFAMAVREELQGTCRGTLTYGQQNYLRIGYYGRHLARYLAYFDRSQFHIELFDDLQSDALAMFQRTCRFLDVDDKFEPDVAVKINVSGIPRHKFFGPLLRKSRLQRIADALLPTAMRARTVKKFEKWRERQLVKPPLDDSLRLELLAIFRDDIHRVEKQIGRDLSAWLAT